MRPAPACACRAALLGAALAAPFAGAPALAQETREHAPLVLDEDDWPCPAPYRLEFSPGAVWTGPRLGPDSAAWREDAGVRRLAEEVAAPETALRQAPARIEAFAATLADDPTRNRRLTRLFHGVLDELNLYRRFILEGILGFVARHRLAAEALADIEAELHGLPTDGTDRTARRREALAQQRFWAARALDDAQGEARFLCHRLTALEAKLGVLARAIAAQLEP